MDKSPIRITDTGPLLHLHWAGAATWALPVERILVVETVAAEVQRYEAEALEYPQVIRMPDVPRSQEEWARRLDDGEVAALSLAMTYQSSDPVVFMCDERTARLTASSLGLPVIGSLGLILAAFRSDRVTRETAKRALLDLTTAGHMRISERLLNNAILALDNEVEAH